MSDASAQAIGVVQETLERLLSGSITEGVRVKLRNINEVCSHLIQTGKQRLTVPLLLSTYAAMFPAKDQAIAESSIRNKRGGANPYLELYRAWEDAAEVILAKPRKLGKVRAGEIVDFEELSSITDPSLRHQVRLLITQNSSLKSQVDILKRVRGAPTITLVSTTAAHDPVSQGTTSTKPQLTESEIEAIKDFIAERKLKARGMTVAEDGSLASRDGRALADPGFIDALQKVIVIAAGSV